MTPPITLSDAEALRPTPRAASAAPAKATAKGVQLLRGPDEARKLYNSASTPREKELKKIADQFVSILYNQLFKQMDQTVDRTGLLGGGETEETFRPFLIEQYSEAAARQNGSDLKYWMYEYLYDSNSRTDVPLPKLDVFG